MNPSVLSYKAYDADLNGKQYRAVKFTSSGIVDFSTAATDLSIGILENKPRALTGAVCNVVRHGPCKAKLGGTVSAGQWLVPDSNGDLVGVTLATSTTNVAVARAEESGDDNDIIQVFVSPQFVQV